jgi:hypothetical protein
MGAIIKFWIADIGTYIHGGIDVAESPDFSSF